MRVGRGTGGLKDARGGGAKQTRRLPSRKFRFGYSEHRRAYKDGPDDRSGSDDIIAQWCFPLRRQHAGRFDSRLEARSNPIIGEIVNARSKTARLRRKLTSYAHAELDGNVG